MRSNYVSADANGYIWGWKFSENYDPEWTEVNQSVDIISDDVFYRLVDGEVVRTEIPKRSQNDYEIWDEVNGGWIDPRTLTDLKADKWIEIKAARTAQEFGSFDWGGYTFQCDEVSQRRIQGAVQLAMLDPALTLDWTLADNTVQAFTAAEFEAIGQALAAHVGQCHERGRILRQEIDAATSEKDLEAISW
jgi:hypothetical protein